MPISHEEAALEFLRAIPDAVWGVVCGSQDRATFAAWASDAGQDIEDAWEEAVEHAEGL